MVRWPGVNPLTESENRRALRVRAPALTPVKTWLSPDFVPLISYGKFRTPVKGARSNPLLGNRRTLKPS
jgi:hypothetical protein